MLRPEELRIDSWVQNHHNQIFQVTLINLHGIRAKQFSTGGYYGPESFNFKEIAPIPVSAEILIKCGFEVLPWGFVFKGNDFALLLAWDHKEKFWVEIGNGTKIYFSYLHQLQNMLQLCGQELTYTP